MKQEIVRNYAEFIHSCFNVGLGKKKTIPNMVPPSTLYKRTAWEMFHEIRQYKLYEIYPMSVLRGKNRDLSFINISISNNSSLILLLALPTCLDVSVLTLRDWA